jgi:NADH-quinone oxidoreductase subunit J
VFAFEVTSALLITAALGAMVLAHRERAEPKQTQKDLSRARFVRFGQLGRNPGPLPGPGTYARHNAIDMPALLPDGSVSPLSVNRVVARYEAAEGTLPPEVERILQEEALSERANGHGARPLGEEDGK